MAVRSQRLVPGLGEDNEVDFDIRTALGDEYSDVSGASGDPYEVISLKLYVH